METKIFLLISSILIDDYEWLVIHELFNSCNQEQRTEMYKAACNVKEEFKSTPKSN